MYEPIEPQGEMSRMYLGLDDWNYCPDDWDEGDDFLCGDRDIFEEWE